MNSQYFVVSSIVNLFFDNILIGLGGESFNSSIPETPLNATKSPVSNFKYFLHFLFCSIFSMGSISTIPGQEFVIDFTKYFLHFFPSLSCTKKLSPKSANKKETKPI